MSYPHGFPQGYSANQGNPYGLDPNAASRNSMYPPLNASHTIQSSIPYATSSAPPYEINNPYPNNNSTYPPNIQRFPPISSSMYPTNSQSNYPQTNPSPYPPSSQSTYPPSNPSTYPPSNPSPYPPSNSSPYPSSSQSTYPPSNPSPYPSNSQSIYPPSNPSPYPPSSQSTYPPNNPSCYPPSTLSSYPSNTPSYPMSNPPHLIGNRPPSVTSGSSYPKTANQNTFPGNHSFYPGQKHTSRNMAQYVAGHGTVQPYPGFDPKQDAEALRKAMKGFGTDEKAIISVLAKRSNAQRVYIGVAFQQLYGKDLIDDLKSELSGNFENVIVALMMPTNDFLARELHNAISGVGTDEDVLIEILCTRTNAEIWAIKDAYNRLYGKMLEEDIKSDTSGHFQRLLVSVCTGVRSEAPADNGSAKQQAQALFEAGVGQWGTDESTFNRILAAESFPQLALIFYEYEKLIGHSVVTAIDREMSGDLKKGMLAIARCVENRPFYFAEKLYKAMKVGLGTDDNTLIRIVVTRCEIDMVQIKAEYERNYGKPLGDAISGDTSGDYKRVLLALVGN